MLVLHGFAARADGPLGPEGSPITTSSYTVDFTRGTVLSASRVTGLAGAFSAIAEGAEGGLSNPASVAVRSAGSVDWWDYWLALGFTYPLENGDYYNDGQVLTQGKNDTSFFFLNPGAYLQAWGLGLGLDVDIQQVTITGVPKGETEERKLELQVINNHVQMGTLLWDGNIVIGGGLQVLRERVLFGATGERLGKVLEDVGFGGEAGLLIRPNGEQWRIGAGLYSYVKTGSGSGNDTMVGSSYVPESAARPWQGSVAFAYQFGERPLNPRFTHVDEFVQKPMRELEHRRALARAAHEQRMAQIRAEGGSFRELFLSIEREQFAYDKRAFDREREAIAKAAWRTLRAQVRTGWPRRYVLLTSELAFTGRVDNAVGVMSFMTGTVQRSGERVTVTPRLAAESEVWPTRMKVRGGIYVEPSRFRDVNARVHGTLGLDIRVLHWDVFGIWPEDYLWQISAAFDVTRDYSAFSTSIGGWY